MTRDLDRLAPLAERMRPRDLAEFVGQEHILGPDTVLRRSLDAGHIPSMVLWGPPGTGKTTLAQIIANSANAHFERVSAVTSGVADLRRVVSDAADRLGMHGERTILFVDEIHRFNKAQQDVILPHVERGTGDSHRARRPKIRPSRSYLPCCPARGFTHCANSPTGRFPRYSTPPCPTPNAVWPT